MVPRTKTCFYDIAIHKNVMQRVFSHLTNKETFLVFCVSSHLRRLWYIQYERMKNSKPFHERAAEVKRAREWRKVFMLEQRLEEFALVKVDIYKRDPMEKFRVIVQQTKSRKQLLGKRRRPWDGGGYEVEIFPPPPALRAGGGGGGGQVEVFPSTPAQRAGVEGSLLPSPCHGPSAPSTVCPPALPLPPMFATEKSRIFV